MAFHLVSHVVEKGCSKEFFLHEYFQKFFLAWWSMDTRTKQVDSKKFTEIQRKETDT